MDNGQPDCDDVNIARYPLWQPALTSGPTARSGSYQFPGAGSLGTAATLPGRPLTSRSDFPFPSPSPLPLPHGLPPGLGPQYLRFPVPLHQLPHHPFPHHRHIHHLDRATATTAHLMSPGKDRETSALGPTSPASTAGALFQSALPLPADLRRPLPLVYNFTPADLDNVLYGYMRASKEPSLCGLSCAMSGLRMHEIDLGRKTPYCSLPPPCVTDMIGDMEANTAKRAHSGLDREKPASRPLLDIRTVNLPEGISITQATVGGLPHYSVFCHTTMIRKGTRFGPFTGRIIHPSEIKSNDDTSFMWEIFQDGKLSHFVDGRNGASNWLCFVNCARHAQEQNLISTQSGKYIYYEAYKDIPKGTELLVWYGDSYCDFMGIPLSLKGMVNNRSQTESDNLQAQEGYKCDRCGKVFSYKDYRDKHLKYTRCVDKGDRKFPCDLCTRSFEKKDRLRIHILHVHHKHRPHKCNVCGKSFSQSSSLNKHIRVHSGERPYKCVYCSKAFTASSILRTHIRQHSGEKPFKCKHCGKPFASHAAHDSHVRRTHTKDKPCVCLVCGKTFPQNYELRFHMNIHPEHVPEPYGCEKCALGFNSAAARDQHSLIHEYRRNARTGNLACAANKDIIME